MEKTEYIERETVLKKIESGAMWVRSFGELYEAVQDIPSADVAPVRHGRIIQTIEDGRMKRVFSCCGTDFTQMTCWMTPKYCPECGAIIDGGESNET